MRPPLKKKTKISFLETGRLRVRGRHLGAHGTGETPVESESESERERAEKKRKRVRASVPKEKKKKTQLFYFFAIQNTHKKKQANLKNHVVFKKWLEKQKK